MESYLKLYKVTNLWIIDVNEISRNPGQSSKIYLIESSKSRLEISLLNLAWFQLWSAAYNQMFFKFSTQE